MNDTDRYILDAIKTWVWSDFYDADEVDEMIGDMLEEGATESLLRAAVRPEFEKKRAAEASWPETTDVGKKEVGKLIGSVLEKAGFKVDWNGDPEKRIDISGFDWKCRSAG